MPVCLTYRCGFPAVELFACGSVPLGRSFLELVILVPASHPTVPLLHDQAYAVAIDIPARSLAA